MYTPAGGVPAACAITHTHNAMTTVEMVCFIAGAIKDARNSLSKD